MEKIQKRDVPIRTSRFKYRWYLFRTEETPHEIMVLRPYVGITHIR